ncbi:MAG: LysR family transcriptional regulator [Pseudomonadota bacterium]
MKYWTEMRTALTLARLGTVSATAVELSIHRATVNRHVDTLESAFGGPLFQRHARGYALTEAGQDLLEVASRADEMFSELEGRSKSRASQVSGKLTVSALAGIAPSNMRAITEFNKAHPSIEIEYVAEHRLARLEYGEAHVAFRAGPKPTELDYVVRPYRPIRFGLYASQSYIDRHGMPDFNDLSKHQFIVPSKGTGATPYTNWLAENVPPSAFALKTNDYMVRRTAICHGMGLGFIDDQETSFLNCVVEIMPPSDVFEVNLWVVTHVDLHRSPKVQALLEFLS